MNNFKSRIWLLVAVIFALCLTVYAFSYLVTKPGNVILALGGDAGKNYFTYLYQSMYGKGMWFNGMNYPYGENIVFTDGQPLLSVLFGYIGNISAQNALIVMGWLIDLSFVLSIIYIYKILLHFNIKNLPAILFACLIAIFSPQVFSVIGHYALAYCSVIPMLFYWTLKYHYTNHWKYCLYIFILGCIAEFLHPYYAAMILVWAISYSVGYIIFIKQNLINKVKHIYPLLLSTITIFIILTFVMKITDPIKDRPIMPYGILVNCTVGDQILTSVYSPVWKYAKEKSLVHDISDGGEGYTYLGMTVIIAFIISVILGIIKKNRKTSYNSLIVKESYFSPIWLFIAFLSLLLAMGVPFVWNMDWLLKYASAFRQFRTLGRFSWIFYYIISIYSVVAIYSWYSTSVLKNKRYIGISLLLFCLGVWGYEATGYIKIIRDTALNGLDKYEMFFSENEKNWKDYLNEHHYKANDFQAILLVPFFDVGSEKLWVGGDGGWSLTLGARASLQLHLPIVDVLMSRSSWSQAEKQVKIAGGPYVDKPLLHDIKNDKPFLLLQMDFANTNANEAYLLKACDSIGHYSQAYIYALYPERLAAMDKKNRDSIIAIVQTLPTGDTCIGCKGSWYVNHFDLFSADTILFGGGALPHTLQKDTIIAEIPVKTVNDTGNYELSCWFFLGKEDYSSPYIILKFKDANGNVLSQTNMLTKESVDNIGMWFRSSVFFKLPEDCRNIECSLHDDNILYPAYKVMDEMMLIPPGALIISKSDKGEVMVNNHLLYK